MGGWCPPLGVKKGLSLGRTVQLVLLSLLSSDTLQSHSRVDSVLSPRFRKLSWVSDFAFLGLTVKVFLPAEASQKLTSVEHRSEAIYSEMTI